MHFFSPLFTLLFISLRLAIGSTANPMDSATDVQSVPNEEPVTPYPYMTNEEMDYWLANTDAKVTHIGEPYNPLRPRASQDTRVVYCSTRIGNICGGECNTYSGGSTCLNAPGTECLSATHNIGYCSTNDCREPCTQLSDCIMSLQNNFCATPNTNSIAVGNA